MAERALKECPTKYPARNSRLKIKRGQKKRDKGNSHKSRQPPPRDTSTHFHGFCIKISLLFAKTQRRLALHIKAEIQVVHTPAACSFARVSSALHILLRQRHDRLRTPGVDGQVASKVEDGRSLRQAQAVGLGQLVQLNLGLSLFERPGWMMEVSLQ